MDVDEKVSSPEEEANKLIRKNTMEKASMTDSRSNGKSYCAMPVNLAISVEGDADVSRISNTNALIIGELPSNINEIYSNMVTNRKSSSASLNPVAEAMQVNKKDDNKLSSKILPYLMKKTSKLNVMDAMVRKSTIPSDLVIQEEIEDVTNELKPTLDKIDEDKKEAKPVREQWSRKTEFLLAIIGFSVDLGNIWRFPKVVYENGGGRFLVPYFVQLALCGLPLFYMELALGQFHQTGLFTLWEKICPILKGLAFTVMIINLFMAMFYNTVISWAVYYLLLSFNPVVPWKGCGNEWNTLCCFPINDLNKISMVSNYSYDESLYQKKAKHGLIFHNEKSPKSKRLLVFDTNFEKTNNQNNISYIFDGISDYFNGMNLTFSGIQSKNLTIFKKGSPEFKIAQVINSYFILYNNKITESPTPFIRQQDMLKYAHDSGSLRNMLERHIEEVYKNKTIQIIVNCAQTMNNPTQEFYARHLTEIHRSTGLENLGSIKWELLGCLFLVFLSVYFALWRGIKSAGKAVWITATVPYIVMFILLIRGITLEGSSIGIDFYLSVTDWSSLLEGQVWIDAATQIFFSLGPGFGTIIALSSYNKKTNNIYKDALLTSLINSLTSILSGFVVFSTLGHMAFVQGKSIHEVVEPGPGLIFVTYPQAISMMPFAPFWAIIFFFMLFTLGIDSTFGGLESVITAICDNFPNTIGKKRSLFVLGLLTMCFIGAFPTVTYGGSYIVHLFDSYTVAPSILLVAFLEAIAVMYIYGCDRFCSDIYEMIRVSPSRFWIVCWKYISPFAVLLMTLFICHAMVTYPLKFGLEYSYGKLGNFLGILIVCVPLSFMPIYALYRVYISEGETLKEKFLKALRPADYDTWQIKKNEALNVLEQYDLENLKLKKIKKAKYVIINFNNSNQENSGNFLYEPNTEL